MAPAGATWSKADRPFQESASIGHGGWFVDGQLSTNAGEKQPVERWLLPATDFGGEVPPWANGFPRAIVVRSSSGKRTISEQPP